MTTHIPIYRVLLFVGMLTFGLFVATPAYAAQFNMELNSSAVAPGSEVVVSVYLNTEGELINAVGGSLSIPQKMFDVVSVRDGSSIVPVWIEAPKVSGSSAIVFSGITPGGYRGDRGLLFTLVLRAKSEGSGALTLTDLQALKNDGNGTAAKATSIPVALIVSNKAHSSVDSEAVDTAPPEPFTIQIVQTPDAFDNKKVLVFSAQDKSSGMSHYQVCEGLFASCVTGESSYVLQRQQADVLITVIAYDNSGNMRTERLFTSAAVTRYSLYAILAILVGVGVWFFRRRRN